MAQEYDVVLKLLFRQSGLGILRELTGSAVARWLDKELPDVRNTRADMLGETKEGQIVHLEFQSDIPKVLGLRMAGYYVEIYRRFDRHPIQVLIYVGRAKLRLNPRFKSPTMDFRFEVVDLSKMDGDSFLNSGLIGDRILAVLMRLKNRTGAIRKILKSIAGLDPKERADAMSQLLVISGLRGLTAEIEREAQRMPILESLMDNPVFAREYNRGLEKGLEKGREEGKAELLRRQIAYRFKRVPKWAENRLVAATSEQIDEWSRRLLDSATLREVFIPKS